MAMRAGPRSHRRVVEHTGAVCAGVIGGPLPAVLEQAFGLVGVAEDAPFVGKHDLHDFPATVDLADAPVVGHPHVGVEGDVGAVSTHGPHRLDFNAFCVNIEQEHREATVLGDVGVGAG